MRPLTKKQKGIVARLATEAFNHQDDLGLVDAPGDTKAKRLAAWRHKEQAEACGKPSLTKADQDDFLPLCAHFNSILGRDDKAFLETIQHQPVTDHSDPDDTTEHRKQKLYLIEQAIKGTKFHINYALKIAKNKFGKPGLRDLSDLTVKQLEQVLYTITNRINQAKP